MGYYAYHVDLGGNVISPSPFSITTGCMDLAWDGEYLWAVHYPGRLRRYDVNTGTENKVVFLPSYGNYESYGITSDGNYLYISGDSIIQEPYSVIWIYDKDGNYVGQIDDPEWDENPSGLAYGTIETGIESASLGRIKAMFR